MNIHWSRLNHLTHLESELTMICATTNMLKTDSKHEERIDISIEIRLLKHYNISLIVQPVTIIEIFQNHLGAFKICSHLGFESAFFKFTRTPL